MNKGLWLLMLVAALAAGCSRPSVFQAATPIPGGAWERPFKPRFEVEVTDSISKHDVYIDIRHTGVYPFSDLFLFVDLEGPGGRHLRDTVECMLADPDGRWYGKGLGFIFADRFQAKVLYKMEDRFPTNGTYAITLEQAMRAQELPGVLDIGVTIERSRKTGSQ